MKRRKELLRVAMVEYFSAKRQVKAPPNFARKSCQDHSSDMHWLRRESGKELFWLQTSRSWENWTLQKSTVEDSMQKK